MAGQLIENFSLTVASVNGSGTQSANNVLAKAMFRSGHKVSAKNLFPSNIAGLPTWFTIRTHVNGYSGLEKQSDIFISRNADTVAEDVHKVKAGGFFFYDAEIKSVTELLRPDVNNVAVPYRELVTRLSDSIRLRKLLSNMIYVGLMSELLNIETTTVEQVIRDSFLSKETVIQSNLSAFRKGLEFAQTLKLDFPFKVLKRPALENYAYMDGNSAAALGAVVGGCTFLSWYPITPASSLSETFSDLCKTLRPEDNQTESIVQAEDELSAASMVIGAGWAGARAMTSTSGPGLSLMAEAVGLSYFAEIPTVIWDVQRAGPSTGLPTRTMQGDLEFAARLSHGDTEHIVLIPSTPEECYEFAQVAFDLAEKYQTVVIVLSDLDLGMNFRVNAKPKLSNSPFSRGKVLTADDLNGVEEFARYKDVDGDGVCYRTLPGTKHMKAAYFTRGTGHNEKAGYSEDGENYSQLLTRLKKKIDLASQHLPKHGVDQTDSKVALVSYGSTSDYLREVQDHFKNSGVGLSHICIKALPLSNEFEAELSKFEKLIVVEQNRDAQMFRILAGRFPKLAARLQSVTTFDGLPVQPQVIIQKLEASL